MSKQPWDYKPKRTGLSNQMDPLGQKVKKKGKSFIMTKPSMAKHLLSRIDFQPEDIICDPGKGDGAFFNNFPKDYPKVWFEINDGKDYLGDEIINVDYTISNPPFVPRKLFWGFMVRAMETTKKKIFWLLNLQSMNVFTPRRLQEMKDKGWFITSQYIVADKRWYGRYAFVEIGKSDVGYYNWCSQGSF